MTNKQRQKFVETARALGCDEDKERFEAALGKIAKAPASTSSPEKTAGPKTKKR